MLPKPLVCGTCDASPDTDTQFFTLCSVHSVVFTVFFPPNAYCFPGGCLQVQEAKHSLSVLFPYQTSGFLLTGAAKLPLGPLHSR